MVKMNKATKLHMYYLGSIMISEDTIYDTVWTFLAHVSRSENYTKIASHSQLSLNHGYVLHIYKIVA